VGRPVCEHLFCVAADPPILQTIFFNLYIFCVVLRVGPQCFAELPRNGKPFVGVAALAVTALLAIVTA
jgi:uncharacterized transporter YbjL